MDMAEQWTWGRLEEKGILSCTKTVHTIWNPRTVLMTLLEQDELYSQLWLRSILGTEKSGTCRRPRNILRDASPPTVAHISEKYQRWRCSVDRV